MADPYLGEIRLFGCNFAPQGWAFCEGQILQIQQNQALYSLLGNTYGGDGKTTFALPDLRGRVPLHFNSTFPLGDNKGENAHTLTQNEMPAHTHQASGSSTTPATSVSPANSVWGTESPDVYGPASALVQMNPSTVATSGKGLAHSNMQPYLTMNFCIALEGIFPSRN